MGLIANISAMELPMLGVRGGSRGRARAAGWPRPLARTPHEYSLSGGG
jgi:hypothetical protein